MEKTPLLNFLSHLDEYAAFLEHALKAQKEQLEALLTHDVAIIEQTVAQQQAIAMQMKNLEELRLKKQEQAGFGTMTLQEIEEHVDEETRQTIHAHHIKMQDTVNQIKFLNDRAMQLVQTNLQLMNQSMPLSERTEAQGYTGHGRQAEATEGSSIFEKKI